MGYSADRFGLRGLPSFLVESGYSRVPSACTRKDALTQRRIKAVNSLISLQDTWVVEQLFGELFL